MTQTARDAVHKAYKNKTAENGHMTIDQMTTMFHDHAKSMKELIDQRMLAMQKTIHGLVGRLPCGSNDLELESKEESNQGMPFADSQEEREAGTNTTQYQIYNHSGLFGHVPENFQLNNKMNLRSGFRLWIYRMPGH